MQRSCCLLIALLFLAGVPSTATADLLQDCRQAEPDRRIVACTQIIAEGSTTGVARAVVHVHRGQAYVRNGDLEQAYADATEAIGLDANSASAFNLRGFVLQKRREYDRAIADYSQAIQLDPGLAVAYLNRGDTWDDKGELDRAIADLNEAIRLDNTNARAFHLRGHVLQRKREYDQAIPNYTEAIRLDPKSANIYLGRAGAYRAKGDYQNALADYDNAIRIDRAVCACAYFARGQIYADKGEMDRAVREFTEAIGLDPKMAEAYYNRGFIYSINNEEYDIAIADFDKAIAIDSKDARFYHSRGIAYLRKRNYDRAIAELNEAIRLNAKAAISYLARGNTYEEKGEYQTALADYDEAIRIDASICPCAYVSRGVLYWRIGDMDRAIAEYTKALQHDPKHPLAYNNRGLVYEAKGDRERALVDFSDAIRFDPKSAMALNNRGKLYEAMGDRDRAIADYAMVLTLPKNSADTRQRQETALARLGRLNQPKAASSPSVGKRVALVIGNGSYAQAGVLDNPTNDARGVASSLRKLGFTVKDYYDLNRSQMVEALADFGDLVAGADWAVVFYAGHGVEMDGTNYLMPIDVKLKRDTDVPLEGVSLNAVLAKVDAANQLGLVILDACRNNPFVTRMVRSAGGKRSISQGLGRIEPEGNTAVAYSARHDTTAEDGPTGGNSPFSAALLGHIEEPGTEIRILFGKVRDDVRRKTERRQEPFLYSSLGGEQLFFAPSTPR